jgi:hypothetical protein
MTISDLNAPPKGEAELPDLNKEPAQEEDNDDPLQQPTTRGTEGKDKPPPIVYFFIFYSYSGRQGDERWTGGVI